MNNKQHNNKQANILKQKTWQAHCVFKWEKNEENATKRQRKRREHSKQEQGNGIGFEHMELMFKRQLFVVGMIWMKEQVSPKIKRHHLNR